MIHDTLSKDGGSTYYKRQEQLVNRWTDGDRLVICFEHHLYVGIGMLETELRNTYLNESRLPCN